MAVGELVLELRAAGQAVECSHDGGRDLLHRPAKGGGGVDLLVQQSPVQGCVVALRVSDLGSHLAVGGVLQEPQSPKVSGGAKVLKDESACTRHPICCRPYWHATSADG